MAATREVPRNQGAMEDLHLDTSELRIKQILVPTDFSESATKALEVAIAIAELYNSKLTLVHASHWPNFIGGESFPPPEFLVDQAAEDKQLMQSHVASHPKLSKLHVETVVDYADPIPMIRKLVEERLPDLIVLGSHGAKEVERITLGSLAENLARHVACPVLIIGPHAQSDIDLFKTIVFATDLKSTGLRPAQYASSFAEHFHSDLLVLHVEEESTFNMSDRRNTEARLMHDLEALVPGNAKMAFHPQFRVEYGKVSEQIVEAARSVKAGLVILGARRAGPLASHLPWLTLPQIIREAGCGVLVVGNHFL